MPIPVFISDEVPRRLLRDIVFDKLLAAITDGTLEPGERLNDDQLVKWLQVSRTPVREALAQLRAYGLVEIEANRFTRVSRRNGATYAEAAQFLAGIHALAREWGVKNLDASARAHLLERLRGVQEQLAGHDIQGPGALMDVQSELVRASRNTLLSEAEGPLRVRVNFLRPRAADAYDWDALDVVADVLAAALAHE